MVTNNAHNAGGNIFTGASDAQNNNDKNPLHGSLYLDDTRLEKEWLSALHLIYTLRCQ